MNVTATHTVSNVMAERFWPAVPDSIWDRIREEFTLPDLDEIELHFETLYGDPAPMMHQVFRVFIDEGTFCPGFQFKDGLLDPAVLRLFRQAMELGVPHNVFAAWMITPLRSVQPAHASRPVNCLEQEERLAIELAAFADRYRPAPTER